jgi:UTP--glucose-1-phosphate uridylyltransferase
VQRLSSQAKSNQASLLESFYKRVDDSTIVWVNQPDPRGFGDAVLQAERLVKGERFFVHAGDTHIISRKQTIAARLREAHANSNADAVLTIKEVKDPRQYGVAEVYWAAGENLKFKKVVEKPSKPSSKLAIMPVYIFTRTIFEALKMAPPRKGGEVQLTLSRDSSRQGMKFKLSSFALTTFALT